MRFLLIYKVMNNQHAKQIISIFSLQYNTLCILSEILLFSDVGIHTLEMYIKFN